MKWQNKRSSEDDETSECGDNENVRTVGNNIYFYDDVTTESILELTVQIKKLTTELSRKAVDTPGYEPYIDIHINSGGGDVFSGLAGMDTIYNNDIWINTYVDGMCASAATFLLLGGHYRYMNRHSYVLIHQLTSGYWGKYEEMKDDMVNNERIMKTIINLYKKYTNVPEQRLGIFMKKDIYIDANKCLRYQIVDEISA